MNIEELDYDLPENLVATQPIEPRDACRLMVIHRSTGRIEHRIFRDLREYLDTGDLLVLNSARVTPARLLAERKSNPPVIFDLLVIDAGDSPACQAMIHPTKKVRTGDLLQTFSTGQSIRMGERSKNGFWQLQLENPSHGWKKLLEKEGRMPLPPYILKRRKDRADVPEDHAWYQTCYSDRDGAIAAPTAGLHFSTEMLTDLNEAGVDSAKIFLKVGVGTFQPVHAQQIENHVLLPEEYDIPLSTEDKIRKARQSQGRVIAVGTTAVRTLEHVARESGSVSHGHGSTGLMILPGWKFRAVDALITNFHIPRTTLLALVYAFGGKDLIRNAYEEAVKENYRFFSYGDAMLIL